MDHFNSADRLTVVALLRMKSPEMKPLLTFFENMGQQTMKALVRAKGDDVLELQGRAKLIDEFLTAVNNSAAVVEKLR